LGADHPDVLIGLVLIAATQVARGGGVRPHRRPPTGASPSASQHPAVPAQLSDPVGIACDGSGEPVGRGARDFPRADVGVGPYPCTGRTIPAGREGKRSPTVPRDRCHAALLKGLSCTSCLRRRRQTAG
jgi:hypothetical protein